MDEFLYHKSATAPQQAKSSPISSPPQSPDQSCTPDDGQRQPHLQTQSGAYGHSPLYSVTRPANADQLPAGAAPVKQVRKKRELNGSSAQKAAPKEKKTRKPRDPNAPPRKKMKPNDDAAANGQPSQTSQTLKPAPPNASYGFGPTLAPNNTPLHNGHQRYSPPPPPPPQYSNYAQIGKSEGDTPRETPHYAQYGIAQQTQQHQLSRPPPGLPSQRYDPIRSASLENARLAATPAPPYAAASYQNPNYGRASPPVASVVGQPSHTQSAATARHKSTPSPHQPFAEPRHETPIKPAPVLAPAPAPAPTAGSALTLPATKVAHAERSLAEQHQSAIDKVAKRVASPKPLRKKASPPVALGNGLLSGADFGKKGPSEPKEYAQVPNQCIVIDVPIKNETGNYINFLQEVEKKYGFDVAHPRIAEHRRRMQDMAVAGAMIEFGTGVGTADDMDSDLSEHDTDVGMGGVTEDSDAKKKRRTKMDQYDVGDEFIDDTEQAWQEQALASKDGYFVWSGPLVQAGDNPTVERADGTVKRGRGSRGGRVGTRGGTTRGRADAAGRATRGATATRKPRMKKAERLERERVEREKAAANLPESTQFPGVVGASNV